MKRKFLKKRWIYSLSLLAIVSLINFACRKKDMKERPDEQTNMKKTAISKAALRIDVEEVYAALPPVLMHNIDAKLYVGRVQWKAIPDGVMIRIPTSTGNNGYIYATKTMADPGKVKVYAVQYIPGTSSTDSNFTGKGIWIDFQDWKSYGLDYKDNVPVSHMVPQVLAQADWEILTTMHGHYYTNANGMIAVQPPPANSITCVRNYDNPADGIALGNFFGSILNWLAGIMGESGGGPVVPGGGNWEPGPGSGPGNGWDGPGGGGGWSTNPTAPGGPSSPDPNPLGNPVYLDGNNVTNTGIIYDPNNTVGYLHAVLGLNSNQVSWLNQHLGLALQIKSYWLLFTPNVTPDQKREIAREHLIRMMDDPAYLTFVNNYNQNNTGMWWMNEDWVNDPAHFYLGSNTGIIAAWNTLTTAEKDLVKLYPVQAFIIFTRFGTAQDIADATNLPHKINGKRNAFCHAFFQAISVRDMVPRFTPIYMSRAQIVLLFATAHESEVPPALDLEKQMDLFNNSIGITYGESISIFTLDNTLTTGILNKVANGELKYLTPLDFGVSDIYDRNGDHIQDCPTCFNGIVPATQLKPTNQ